MSWFDCLTVCLQGLVVLFAIGWAVMWILRRLKIGRYDDKYVFITGCDTGFGQRLTQRLDTLGLHVFAGCLTQNGAENIQKICSKNVTVVEVNVTEKESIKNARTMVQKRLPKNKGLWAVVNNAGIAGPVSPTEWLTNEDFDQTIAVNLMGVIYVTKMFLPLVRKEEGRIVNMASICGRLAIATAAYNASKFGVIGFTDSLRHELYKTGVSVSVIEPGFFKTGIVDDNTIRQGLDKRFASLDKDTKQYYGTSYKDSCYVIMKSKPVLKIYQENSEAEVLIARRINQNCCLDDFEITDQFMISQRATSLTSLVLSPRIDKVVDAYVHAVTAKYPKVRYTVGWDANILFRFLMYTPDWFTDFLFGFLQESPAAKLK